MYLSDFSILIIQELAKHGYYLPQDDRDDFIDELYHAIYGYHPNSVFSTSLKFKNGTIVFYFKENEHVTDLHRWAVGINIGSLAKIPPLPPTVEYPNAKRGKIRWIYHKMLG